MVSAVDVGRGITARAAAKPTVTILRDSFGVPHVDDSPIRTAYALGYATAEDRLWQLEVYRRVAEGRLAEVFGSVDLQIDEITRRDGYTDKELRAMYRATSRQNRQLANAFIAGINFYISQAKLDPAAKLPVEFTFYNFFPAPWNSADLTAAAVLLNRAFAVGGNEVDNAAFYLQLVDAFGQSKGQGIFNDFFWITDPAAPTTIPFASGHYDAPPTGAVQRFNADQISAVTNYASQIEAADMTVLQDSAALLAAQRRHGLSLHQGPHSNAIVISGALTQDGAPLLLGGPQNGLAVPNPWHEYGARTGGSAAAGLGAPVGTVAVGRTQDAVYTLTAGLSDVIDTYIDTFDPAHPNKKLKCRTETFTVSGQSQPVTLKICRTVHGRGASKIECPVFYQDPAAGVAFSRCSAFWKSELKSGEAVGELANTNSLAEFEKVLPGIVLNHTFTYADREGNIAYFHEGRFPIRPANTDPRFPLLGGSEEWTGFVPESAKPRVLNPGQGWLANWNNDPESGWPALEQREEWGAEDRVQGIADIIQRKLSAGKLTLNDLNEINFEVSQKDVFASRSVPYLENAIAGVPSADPDYAALNQAGTLIDQWLGKTSSVGLFDVATQNPYTGSVGGDGNGAPLIFPPLMSPPVSCANFSCNYPDAGLALYELWRQQLQHDLFDGILGARNRQIDYYHNVGDPQDAHGNFATQDAVLLHLLQGSSASVPPSCDYFNGCAPIDSSTYDANRDQFLVNSLREVIHGLQSQSLTPADAAAAVQTETFVNSSAYPAQTINWMNRGTFNILAEAGSQIASFDVMPPGESALLTAQGGPPNVFDQLGLYASFEYKPLTIDAPPGSAAETIPVVLHRKH
jgi:penicillin G amidase